jgi:hypothetical protein
VKLRCVCSFVFLNGNGFGFGLRVRSDFRLKRVGTSSRVSAEVSGFDWWGVTSEETDEVYYSLGPCENCNSITYW